MVMKSIEAYKEARRHYLDAVAYFGQISAANPVQIAVDTDTSQKVESGHTRTVHCVPFDDAFSLIVRRRFDELGAATLDELRDNMNKHKKLAVEELRNMLDEMNEEGATK